MPLLVVPAPAATAPSVLYAVLSRVVLPGVVLPRVVLPRVVLSRVVLAPTLALVALTLLALPGMAGAALCTESRPGGVGSLDPALPNPILFVTQFPIAADFATIGSTFANHQPSPAPSGRGGDLWILYPDNTLCNLTREGGFGEAGAFQGPSSISVRDPNVHWNGDRALFSMVIGAPAQRFGGFDGKWQIYEVVGLAQGVPLTLSLVPNQPDANNITPIYSSDGRIVFTSDRPMDGRAHLYPQLDEYESTPTNTGLYALDPSSGDLQVLDFAPSGDFTPIVDSYGRLVFTRWDHLQTDQQDGPGAGPIDFASEEVGAPSVAGVDIFPEPRFGPTDDDFNDHRFNHFFPWMIFPDGTELETLNHIGRHELHDFFHGAFDNGGPGTGDDVDGNVVDFFAGGNRVENLFQLVEDPTSPGRYVGIAAPEFATHASGGILAFESPPERAADQITVDFLTHPATQDYHLDGPPPAGHTGHYRDPFVLSDGRLLAAHTDETRDADEEGTFDPNTGDGTTDPRYDFRLKLLAPNGTYQEPIRNLSGVGGIARTASYFDPDSQITFDGPFWEMSAVEVRSRPQPPVLGATLPAPESQIFAEEGVDPADLEDFLRERDLAMVVSRDVTTRDAADRQQPFNLRIADGTAQTVPEAGIVYDLKYLQFLQGDLVRGYSGPNVGDGRRVLARLMHEDLPNPPTSGAEGSVNLAPDGSMAAFVPAARSLTWQLTDPANAPVVRERYWVTFAAGEIRVCASCHGLNSTDQAGGVVPTQPPEALRQLLRHWKQNVPTFADGFESGNPLVWSSAVP